MVEKGAPIQGKEPEKKKKRRTGIWEKLRGSQCCGNQNRQKKTKKGDEETWNFMGRKKKKSITKKKQIKNHSIAGPTKFSEETS